MLILLLMIILLYFFVILLQCFITFLCPPLYKSLDIHVYTLSPPGLKKFFFKLSLQFVIFAIMNRHP